MFKEYKPAEDGRFYFDSYAEFTTWLEKTFRHTDRFTSRPVCFSRRSDDDIFNRHWKVGERFRDGEIEYSRRK